MAINWLTRASVFKLLAAVYADLGEDAVRGCPLLARSIYAEVVLVQRSISLHCQMFWI